MLTIGFIGAGNMAKAMMQGWQGNAEIRQVLFSPHSGEKVAAELGLEAKQSALDVWAESDMVVLAMPPAQLTDVAKELQLGLMMKPGVIVASVLGGVSLAQLHAALGPRNCTRCQTALAHDGRCKGLSIVFLDFGRVVGCHGCAAGSGQLICCQM